MAAQRSRAPLRAVKSDEKPAGRSTRAARSVADAAKSGDQRQLLVAMRDRIAATVAKPDCPPRDLASLTKRLQDIARDIALIDSTGDDADQRADQIDDSFDASSV